MAEYVTVPDGPVLIETDAGSYFRAGQDTFDIVGNGVYTLSAINPTADCLEFTRERGSGPHLLTMSLGEFARKLNDRIRLLTDKAVFDSV